jgi:hypothetical protein
MRTEEEIVKKIKEVEPHDFMGFQRSDLIEFLSFEAAKPFIREEVTKDQWNFDVRKLERESILKTMLEYMPFAWDKANNCRGISASRSLDHYTVWIWMLEDEKNFGDLTEYQYYGKDNLVKICEFYGWDHTQWDDGERVN